MNRSAALVLALLAVALIAGVAFFRSGPRGSGDNGLVELDGRIEAAREVVAAQAPGKLLAFTVSPGDRVMPRQVVARLQDPRGRTKLTEAEELLAAIEAELRDEQANLALEQICLPLAIRAAEQDVSLAKDFLEGLQSVEELIEDEIRALDELEGAEDPALHPLNDSRHQRMMLIRAEAQSVLERAESDLDLAELGEDDLISHIHHVQTLVEKRDSAAAGVRVAAVGQGDLEIVATSAGLVVSPRAAIGAVLSIGDPVLEVMDPAAVGVVASAAEARRADIRLGQQARMYFDGAPEGHLAGNVSAILDSPGGGTIVKLAFDAVPDPLPPPSLPCKVVIRTRDDARWP